MAEPCQTLTRQRTSVFERLASWSYRRRWRALLTWLAVLAAVTIAAQAAGSRYHNDFSLPGTESQRALDTLRQHVYRAKTRAWPVTWGFPDRVRRLVGTG